MAYSLIHALDRTFINCTFLIAETFRPFDQVKIGRKGSDCMEKYVIIENLSPSSIDKRNYLSLELSVVSLSSLILQLVTVHGNANL